MHPALRPKRGRPLIENCLSKGNLFNLDTFFKYVSYAAGRSFIPIYIPKECKIGEKEKTINTV